MANTVIQLKHSTLTGNVPSSLANGEISINSRDGKFFYSTPAGVVTTHYPYLGPAGLNQEIQFNDSGILGSDSGLSYNKTTDVLTVVGGAIVGGVNVTPQIQFAFTQANTPSYVANSAASYANSGFAVANSSSGYANSAFLRANTPSDVANSAASYANSAFGKSNSAFLQANTPSYTANSAASYANSAFARANNSLDANNGGTVTGTITANSFITTGSFGNIQGANTIYANTFVANTGGYIQFADGSKQFTANAGSGTDTSAGTYANAGFAVANSSASYANAAFAQANTGSGAAAAGSYANSAFSKANSACTAAATAQSTASSAAGAAAAAQSTADSAYNTNDFAVIYTPNNSTSATASGRRDTLNIVGESGVVAYANSSTKTITIAGTPGAQGLTVDYGYVADSLYYAIDYGTL
jgi:hypothetical protein